jgi:hypothetical protein
LQITTDQWVDAYNTGHPHQALGGRSPKAFAYARSKNISAYEKVKSKLNGDLRSPDLTYSTPEKKATLHHIQME